MVVLVGWKMFYKFYCKKCDKNHKIDIKMAEYDKEKNNQKCPECQEKLERVIEWQGTATGNGPGWCGNSYGKTI